MKTTKKSFIALALCIALITTVQPAHAGFSDWFKGGEKYLPYLATALFLCGVGKYVYTKYISAKPKIKLNDSAKDPRIIREITEKPVAPTTQDQKVTPALPQKVTLFEVRGIEWQKKGTEWEIQEIKTNDQIQSCKHIHPDIYTNSNLEAVIQLIEQLKKINRVTTTIVIFYADNSYNLSAFHNTTAFVINNEENYKPIIISQLTLERPDKSSIKPCIINSNNQIIFTLIDPKKLSCS